MSFSLFSLLPFNLLLPMGQTLPATREHGALSCRCTDEVGRGKEGRKREKGDRGRERKEEKQGKRLGEGANGLEVQEATQGTHSITEPWLIAAPERLLPFSAESQFLEQHVLFHLHNGLCGAEKGIDIGAEVLGTGLGVGWEERKTV